MKKCKKYCEEGCGALKLALIITGSIVAAAGIILLLLKLFKRKHVKLPCDCCCDDHESDDSWDIDEDVLNELELDDSDEDETKGCDAEAEDTEEEVEEASEDEEVSGVSESRLRRRSPPRSASSGRGSMKMINRMLDRRADERVRR